MQSIIDRRLSGKNKSIGNRERFLRRVKDQVKEAVRRAIRRCAKERLGKRPEVRVHLVRV